ncbi:hypothetical protein ACTFJL_14405 [Klebsiella electrica]
MQSQLFFTSRQRQFDSSQNIFFTKRCWRIVAVLAGLFCLAILPFIRAEQSGAEAESGEK